MSPGVVYRRGTGGTGDRDDWSPTLNLTLDRRRHSLRAAFSVLDQDGHAAAAIDSLTQRASLAWTYTRGRHRLGVEADWFDRDPSPGSDVEAWRVGAFWTVSFERPAVRPAAPPAAAAAPGVAATARVPDVVELAPGMTLADARTRLAGAGVRTGTERPGLAVFEARALETLDRRQRLALVHDGTRLERAVLVIDVDDAGGGDDLARTYARVREILLRRYGTPERRIEEGDFGPDVGAALADGRLRRLLEWSTASARVRFGIPSRADGSVRIEVQHAPGFAVGARNDWSLERLR